MGSYQHEANPSAFRGSFRILFVSLVVILSCTMTSPALALLRLLPGGPFECEANFQFFGGQDASVSVMEMANSISVRAEDGSSHGSVGLFFHPFISFPATIRMGVSYAGKLQGGALAREGSIRITVTLRDETNMVDIDPLL